MGIFWRIACAALLTYPAGAATAAYEVLNQRNGVLTGVSAIGGATGSLTGTSGYDMAVDANGNFIIATDGPLYRVTPAGVATAITSGTASASFVTVALDASGNFIGADNETHTVYRISPNGATITPVAVYPTSANQLEDVVVRIDGSGNYIVAEDNGSQAHLFRLTPSGSLTSLTLSGATPNGVGGLTFDANGNYVLLDYTSGSIYTITPTGTVTALVSNGAFDKPLGIVRDPSTGSYIVTSSGSNSVFSVGPAGAPISTLASGATLNYPGPVVLLNPGGAGPTISQVLNNYSLIPAAFPNGTIAPGALFLITGVGLADPDAQAILQSSGGSGLPDILNGSTVKVTVNNTSTTPAFYYAIGTQLALVMPSNTPAGSGQVTVSYNNRTSASFPVQVTQSAMAFDTYYGTGTGLGVATNTVTGTYYTYTNPIAPSTTIVLWGSGLGANPARDTTYAPAAFAINNLAHIYIGGMDAPILYQGASGYPGVNQVDVTVPAGVQPGCNVSVVGVTAAGLPTNFITLPIGSGACADPAFGTTGSQIATLSALTTVRSGALTLTQSSAAASFRDTSGVLYGAAIGVVSVGGCTVTQILEIPTTVSIQAAMDAGPLTVDGPNGSITMPSTGSGQYSAALAANFVPAAGGSFTFSAAGGAIGSFNASVTMPGALTWSNQAAAAGITRSAGLPVSWTGGASGAFVAIGGTSTSGVDAGTFMCVVAASAGQFTVPAYVLAALPAGSGAVTVTDASNYQPFAATGIDIGVAQAMVSYMVSATYN